MTRDRRKRRRPAEPDPGGKNTIAKWTMLLFAAAAFLKAIEKLIS